MNAISLLFWFAGLAVCDGESYCLKLSDKTLLRFFILSSLINFLKSLIADSINKSSLFPDFLDLIQFSDWMELPADQSSQMTAWVQDKMFEIETNKAVDNGGIR